MSSDSDPVEALLARHRKELRDLTATITSLKKQATKKTRKNVLSNCSRLEAELKDKQKLELTQLQSGADNVESEAEDSEVTPEKLLAAMDLSENKINGADPSAEAENVNGISANDNQAAPAPKKRNRQKERLAKRQAEIDRLKEEARLEALVVPDYKKLELEAMAAAILEKGLALHEIQPDGNCLFSSLLDQLQNSVFNEKESEIEDLGNVEHAKGGIQNDEIDPSSLLISELRRLAAEYMLDNKSQFVPFMYNEQTDELEDIDEYCHQLTTTSMWGSDKEILAFLEIFNCSIHILSYDDAGAKTHTLTIGGGANGASRPHLNLAYYRHCYGLGEHYNSLRG